MISSETIDPILERIKTISTSTIEEKDPYELLTLCRNCSKDKLSSLEFDNFLHRVSSALKNIKLGINTDFGDISNNVILSYFFEIYNPDKLEEHLLQPSFSIDIQNLCVACTSAGTIEDAGNIGNPILHLLARMQLGNREEFNEHDLPKINQYCLEKNDSIKITTYAWGSIFAKWANLGWDSKHSRFMIAILSLANQLDINEVAPLILALLEYNHYLRCPTDTITLEGEAEGYTHEIRDPCAIERLLLYSIRFQVQSVSYLGKKWWPNALGFQYANKFYDLFFPDSILLNAFAKAREVDKNILPRGISGGVIRIAAEMATGRIPRPLTAVGYIKQGNHELIKEHLCEHIAVPVLLSKEAPSPDDTPHENVSRLMRQLITLENIKALADFIVEGKPLADTAPWEKVSRAFELADRSESITFDEIIDAFNNEKDITSRMIWWIVAPGPIKKAVATKMFVEPHLFGKWFGNELKCTELPIRPESQAVTNYWFITDFLMGSMDCNWLLEEKPMEKGIKKAFSMAAMRNIEYSPGNLQASSFSEAIGRTLLAGNPTLHTSVKVQRANETNEAFLREYYVLQEVGKEFISDLPKPSGIKVLHIGLPEGIINVISSNGLKPKKEPLLMHLSTESHSYWNYAQNVPQDKWVKARRHWILDSTKLLREGSFCHHIGTRFWHNESNKDRPRGFLTLSLPGARLSAGRLNAPKIDYPNVGEGGIRDIGDGWFLSELSKNPELFSVDLEKLITAIPSDSGRRAFFAASWLCCIMLGDTLIISERLKKSAKLWDWRDNKLCDEVGEEGLLGASYLLEGYTGMDLEQAKIFWRTAGVDWQQWGRELLYWYNTDQPDSYKDHLLQKGELPVGLYPKDIEIEIDLSKIQNKSPIGFSLDGKNLDLAWFNGAFPHIEAFKVWNILGPMSIIFAGKG